MDLSKIKHIHFVGIKGVGMAAIAVWAKSRGIDVTGSDLSEEFPTDRLLYKFGIVVERGFDKSHITHPDLVIVTGAHGGLQNPEAREALQKDIPTLLQGEALGWVMGHYQGIAVAGCHGKTTTSAMIAHLLKQGGLDPSFAVGCGEILSLGTAGWAGRGKYFVAEADEYINGPPTDRRPKFLFLKPEIGVVTNIEFDHPDAYKDLAELEKTYLQFMQKVPDNGLLVLGVDSPSVKKILPKLKDKKVIIYGLTKEADVQIQNLKSKLGQTTFRISCQGGAIELSLAIPGLHNAANATAAAIVASHLGLSWPAIGKYLSTFRGTKRRFELIKKSKVTFYDDYAHHPTEIAATITGARAWYPRSRLIVIFQPHTYTRTKSLFKEFCTAFSGADLVIITDIYSSAREKPDPTVSSRQLVRAMIQYHPEVKYLGRRDEVIKNLQDVVRPGDIVITMGAGDIYLWQNDIKKVLP